MKILKLLIISAVLILMNSCTKEDSKISNGFVIFEDNNYELNYGYIEKIQLLQGSQLRIHLSDKKIPFVNGAWENVEPRDNYIVLIIHNPHSDFQKISDYYPLSIGNNDIKISDRIPFLVSSAVTFEIT